LIELFGEVLESKCNTGVAFEEELKFIMQLLDIRALRNRVSAGGITVELLQHEEQLRIRGVCRGIAPNSLVEVVNAPIDIGDVNVGLDGSESIYVLLRDVRPTAGVVSGEVVDLLEDQGKSEVEGVLSVDDRGEVLNQNTTGILIRRTAISGTLLNSIEQRAGSI